jgi:hypothetical protein
MKLLFRLEYTLFIRYKELFYVDLRALTMASLVLGFTSYPSLYYAIFVSLRAPTGGLKYNVAMMVVLILGLLQPITWSSGPGTREVKSFYYPVYTIPKVLLEIRGVLYSRGMPVYDTLSSTSNTLTNLYRVPNRVPVDNILLTTSLNSSLHVIHSIQAV